jgi:hypothetical protein
VLIYTYTHLIADHLHPPQGHVPLSVAGGVRCWYAQFAHYCFSSSFANLHCTGATDAVPADASGEGSFLDRERAALGDDADFFATPADTMATVEDAGEDSDDLLGGGGGGGAHFQADGADEGLGEFESSFPAIDMAAEVRPFPSHQGCAFEIARRYVV